MDVNVDQKSDEIVITIKRPVRNTARSTSDDPFGIATYHAYDCFAADSNVSITKVVNDLVEMGVNVNTARTRASHLINSLRRLQGMGLLSMKRTVVLG